MSAKWGLRILLLFLMAYSCMAQAQMQTAKGTNAAPADSRLKVAIVITDKFDFLDAAGTWEIFGMAVRTKEGQTREQGEHLFNIYFVSDALSPIHSGGGAIVTPNYTFANAPAPDIVVVGAQPATPPELYDWLNAQNARGATIMSVCAGAGKLVRAGLLDGHYATSHHDSLKFYEENFPKVHWVHNRRYVRATDTVFTAGGDGISGMALALHLIDLRFGRKVAQDTADYLEYNSDDWKQDDRVQ